MSEVSNAFIVCMGIGIVFIGLICIVVLCKILSAVCALGVNKTETVAAVKKTPISTAPEKIENRQEIIAAVSAVVAEELGTDISAIRILSFKKI
ncbi:MAG: OadG family protein [Clostridia bacterium]|nr:OadG family protein [Clostridia bacterium]